MLKEYIRSLAKDSQLMDLAISGNLQMAGVTPAEKKAIFETLSIQADKKDNYQMVYWT
ncbi:MULTISPECIES: competence pheromone ComX [unclassified Paenibacillus]|uniref:competence pheromone ComX n=1 Tax=unclassified Paenibacillus TaxID=185978 RepID=UPI000A8FBAAD|nr:MULTISPECIES: competence pheromone ComX [unclassified Paenibacillus]